MQKYTNIMLGAIILFSLNCKALDDLKCSQMLNEGWFKKYKFGGIGEGYRKPLTQETKSSGSTTAFSNSSTEGTTAVSDPGYTSNIWTSETQSTSSWGECSLAELKLLQKQQIAYYEQNKFSLEREIAFGDGGHLESLADFNLCAKKSITNFKNKLKENFSEISELKSSTEKVLKIKFILKSDSELAKICYSDFIASN